MKVLILTYYFPPSGGAGVQRWLKFVKYLPQFDVEPIVLTVDEHDASYPQIDNQLLNEVPSNIRVVKTKTREILSFYKKLSPNKEVPYGGFANESKVGFFQKVSRAIRGNFFLPPRARSLPISDSCPLSFAFWIVILIVAYFERICNRKIDVLRV